jgi:hypothetical protein
MGGVTSELIDALRHDLTVADFDVDGLDGAWGADAAAALFRSQRAPAARALALRTDALATLGRLFVLGLPVPVDALAAALPSLGVAGATSLQLVRVDGDTAQPLVDLRPYAFTDDDGAGAWWIASDLGELALGRAIDEDHVLGVGGASMTLSGLIVPTAVERALDLGTGCGIQSLHVARHAGAVIATDISERALHFARFNAELNRVDGMELRQGDMFAPVAGERFDLVVSNPPFVITPRREGVPSYEYRDGGAVGDGIVERMVREVGEYLAPGGTAQLLGNWEYRTGEDGLDRVRSWVADTDLDVWVIEREVQDASLYAETWIRDGGTLPGSARFDELYAAWLDDFDARGVRQVGFGYITIRRRGGRAPLRRFERIESPLGAGLGSHLARGLSAWAFLAPRSDDDLLAAHFAVAGDVTEQRHYWPGDEHPAAITLQQGSGFARALPAGTALAAVVGACDGELSLGDIIDAVAHLLGVESRALADEVLPEIRELTFWGMLDVR